MIRTQYVGLAESGQIRIHNLDVPFPGVPVIGYSSCGTKLIRYVVYGMPDLGKYKALLDIVFFLYRTMEEAGAGRETGGSGFVVSLPSKRWGYRVSHYYGVTNWHVAVRDNFPIVRLNTLVGGVDVFEFYPEDWHFIGGGYDVAVIPLPIDHRRHKVRAIDQTFFQLRKLAERGVQVDAGDDVFMIGRFVDYDGVQTNKPSVRFGHISIAAAPIRQANGCDRDSIVLDMHSRSGYSGSPVFVYRTAGSDFLEDGYIPGGGHLLQLLGVHWGQFPERWQIKSHPKLTEAEEGSLITSGQYVEGLSGMTCVCPHTAISDILMSPKLVAMREANEIALETSGKAPPPAPIGESALPTTADNLPHKEDFNPE